MAVAAVVGAMSALLLPGMGGATSGQASILAVAAVALAAGHAWAVLVVVPTHLLLAGQIGPQALANITRSPSESALPLLIAVAVIATALIVLRSVPATLSEARFSLLAGPPARRRITRTITAVVGFAALVLPALS